MESIKTFEDALNYIVYKSRENNNPVADAYVAYLLKIQYDKEEKRFYFSDNNITPEKAKEVIEKVNALINAKNDGVVETLKLQITYELSHIQEEDKIEKIKQYFDTELNNILKEITQTPTSKKETDTFQIHKKIFNYLLIKTKQNTLNSLIECDNNNLGINAEREIYLSLDNIFPKSGLTPFLTLSIQDKIAQLNELANTVMGIRLLNCELGKGGIGLMTLEDIKKKLKYDLLLEVKDYYTRINTTSEKYTLIYDNLELELITDEKELKVLDKIRKMITYYRQILTYLSMLIDDLHSSIQFKDNLIMNYENEKNSIIDIIGNQTSISKDQAYPKFQSLAKMYTKFQEQVFILDIRENVFRKLIEFVSKEDGIKQDYDPEEWEGCFEVDVEKLDIYEKQEEPIFSFENGVYQNGATILSQNSTADYLDIKLEFQGFCIVTLLNKKGLLVSGRPNVVVKYKDKYMVFCTHQCVQEFLDNPQKYLDELNEYVKEHPYLINLLNITEEFPNGNLANMFRDKESSAFKYKASKVLMDKGVQTVDHIYEKGYIDPDYVWNEWDLKKKALQLADIMKKKTVSCQTLLSHFRRDNETQVWPLKDSSVNTTVNKGTNLSIPKSYAVGFRNNTNKY